MANADGFRILKDGFHEQILQNRPRACGLKMQLYHLLSVIQRQDSQAWDSCLDALGFIAQALMSLRHHQVL